MSFEWVKTGPNAGQSPLIRMPKYKLPPAVRSLNKVSGGDIEDVESGDPMKLMPRLRQIHKIGQKSASVRGSEKLGYKLRGHTDFQGMRVAIENRRGDVRTGKDNDGHEWRTKMKHPYGYFVGTRGADDEPVDVYVGPKKDAANAYVVHQHKPDGTGYDEDKVMLGFGSKKGAVRAYLDHYDSKKFLGPVSEVSVDRIREMLKSKKKLTKISFVTEGAFLDELEKIAIDPVTMGLAAAASHLGANAAVKLTHNRPFMRSIRAGRMARGLERGISGAPQSLGSRVAERWVGPELIANEHVGSSMGERLRGMSKSRKYRTLRKLRKAVAVNPEFAHTHPYLKTWLAA